MREAATKRRAALNAPRPNVRRQLDLLRRDGLAVALLITATVVLVAMVIWFNLNYSTFPDLLPMHFDAQGNPDRIGERGELSVLLIIAAVVYVVNITSGLSLRLLARMVFAPYLLWSGALLVEVLMWVTLWNVTR